MGLPKSESHRANIAAAMKARKGIPLSEEIRAKMSAAAKGRKLPEWAIAKMRERKVTEETKRKIGAANLGPKSPQWKGGISFEPYSPKFNKQLKTKIRERDNHTCQLCGVEKNIRGKKEVAMVVHHIDYNKKNCREDNLTALCTSCNSKVNINREMWQHYFECKILVA